MPESTLKTLFEENVENKIVLPDFQRSFEWEISKQKSLLASTLIDLSIGALLFLKGHRDDFRSKALGMNNGEYITPKDECLYLLDGQQRLTSLRAFFTDFFELNGESWDKVWDSLYSRLRYRWFVCLKPEVDSHDFFGYNYLHFEDNSKAAEPSEITSYIAVAPIHKTKCDFWYHPNYNPKDSSGNHLSKGLKRNQIIKEAASEYKVPLYTLYSGDLHKDIIKKIASDRLEEIKQIIKTASAEERKKIVISYLSSSYSAIHDDIDQYNDDDDFCEIYVDQFAELRATWVSAVTAYFSSILTNKTSIMELEKNQVARAIAIFTAINEGGQKLSSFDLVVAKAAKDTSLATLPDRIRTFANSNIEISENWAPISKKIDDWTLGQMGCIEDDNRLSPKFQDSFLNIISALVHTNFLADSEKFSENLRNEFFKAQKQLEMTADQINQYTNLTLTCLARAYAFLQFRCGIVSDKDIPYRLMLLPIAFVLASDDAWKSKSTFDKLEFWYWSSIFSGAYREGQNEQSCTDAKLLYKWIVQDSITSDELNTILARNADNKMFNSSDYSDKDTLTCVNETVSIPSAIHSALLQFVLSTQPEDFLPKHLFAPYKLRAWECAKCQNKGWKVSVQRKREDGSFEARQIVLKLQDHHIFPLGTATKIGDSSKDIRSKKGHPLNSPLNRTFISAEANHLILDDSPDKYFNEVSETSLAFHMAPELTDEIKTQLASNDRNIYVKLLEKRFAMIKAALLTRLSGLVY